MERLIRYERLARCAVFTNRWLPFSVSNFSEKFSLSFLRERGDDFLETRIAAQRVPLRIETELTIRWPRRRIAALTLVSANARRVSV